MKSAILFMLVMVGQSHAFFSSRSEDNGKAEFCGDYNCPEFTVIEEFDGYELRHYNSTVWVVAECPVMEEEYWDDHSNDETTFMKLYDYIQGANSRNATMDMTVPVLKSHTNESVTMSFMLPSEYAYDPPTPTNTSLRIYTRPNGNVFVRSFGGFAYGLLGWRNHYRTELAELYLLLETDGQSFDSHTMFYTAGYNGPKQWINRHNEVWLREM